MALLNCESTILKGYDDIDPKKFLGLGPNIIDSCSLSGAEKTTLWKLPFFSDDDWNLKYLWGNNDILTYKDELPCQFPGRIFALDNFKAERPSNDWTRFLIFFFEWTYAAYKSIDTYFA